MTEQSIPFGLQGLIIVAALAGIISYVSWQMRRYGSRDFSVLRVILAALAAVCVALPFVGAYWWLTPREADRQHPLLLGAAFVPIAALELWGFALVLRNRRKKKL
jgi:uncharacterized BrkB/YihY/UPF0761 family membrane protein